MEKTKRKHEFSPSRHSWRFFVVLALFLLVMVKFPIRVLINEVLLDSLIWGGIALACLVVAVGTYRRFGKQAWRFIGVVLVCVGLAGWQVIDLVVLRDGFFGGGFRLDQYHYLAPTLAYNLRYPNWNICRHTLFEHYFGNAIIAITTETNREGLGMGCGG